LIELRYNVPLDIKQVFLETLFPADPLELGRVRDVFQLDHLAGTRETQQHHFRGLFSRDEFPRTDPDHNGRLHKGVPGCAPAGEVYVHRRASAARISHDIRLERAIRQESVRHVRGLLADVPPGDDQCHGEGQRVEPAGRGPVCHVVDLRVVVGGQRVAVHSTSLVGET